MLEVATTVTTRVTASLVPQSQAGSSSNNGVGDVVIMSSDAFGSHSVPLGPFKGLAAHPEEGGCTWAAWNFCT